MPRAKAVGASDMGAGGRWRTWLSFSDGSVFVQLHRSENRLLRAMTTAFCLPGFHLSCYIPGTAGESRPRTAP